MLTSHELFGFMPAQTANEIIDHAYAENKAAYKAALVAVAGALKLRPAFYEKKPRAERHKEMIEVLARPRMENDAGNLLRAWLISTQGAMLGDFLNALGVPHKGGVVEDFPDQIDDAKLAQAIDLVLGKYPRDKVIIYLNAFCSMNTERWGNLAKLLQEDARLQLV